MRSIVIGLLVAGGLISLGCDAGLAAEQTAVAGLETLVGDESPLKPGEVLAFLGDSITQQGAAPGGYVWLIDEALQKEKPDLKATVVKAGISGHKVPDLQARLDRDVLAKKATVVFIYIGINDVWHSIHNRGTPKDRYEAGLHELIERCRQAGALPVLATPTVIGEKQPGQNDLDAMLAEYVALSRKVAEETKTPLCDLHQAFRDHLADHNPENKKSGILTTDGVHLNPAGNQLVAQRAAACLAEALRSRK